MTVMSIDNHPSQAELQFLLMGARMPAQDRAAELTRRVSGALVSSLTATAGAVFLWDLVQLVAA